MGMSTYRIRAERLSPEDRDAVKTYLDSPLPPSGDIVLRLEHPKLVALKMFLQILGVLGQ